MIVLTSLRTSNNWAQRAKSLQCPRPPIDGNRFTQCHGRKPSPGQHQMGATKSIYIMKFVVGL